ncbi:TonB-dependent receptor [Sphingopyxis sp. H115]|uniref:TonB-dependent receptor n=1 Tax=Sphingopyxis sp. H115 TaxID=1759073 RepID=UPI00073709C6|nr:TonB-dependent receptor [Sphingopyxis sp. H115]
MFVNSPKTARCFLLAGSTLASAILATPGAAQQADMAPNSEYADEIVVTGSIRQSQEASIDAKRDAVNLADIAAADSVGRFPDQNSAAALSRLPAVAVQRDQGQERYIQVRGAPNRWTSVSIDGIPLTGVDEGGDSRAFRFDAVPAVLLSQMTVNKSLTADLQADAIVATIDLKTYSPLDAGRGFHITGDLGYGFMDQGGGEQRQGSLRASWSNDVIGVVLGGSHYRRKQLTDNREVGAYDANGPTEFDIRQYQIERWNNGLFGGIEVAASPELRLFAKAIFTEFNDDEQRNQYEFQLNRAASGTRSIDSGDLVGVPLRGSFNYGEYRNRNYIATLGGDYEGDDGLTANFRLNYTKTDNSTYLPLVQSSTSGLASPSLTYDNSDPRFPVVTLYSTVDNAGVLERGPALTNFDQGILSVGGTYMIDARQETEADAYTAKLDLAKAFDSGLTLKGGLYYADRKVAGNNFSFANLAFLGALGSAVGQPFDVNSYVTGTPWDTQFPLGVTLNYVDNRRMRADIDALLETLEGAGLFDPAASIPATDLYDQKEKTLAGYAIAQIERDALTINGGVRIEHYKLDNSGTANIDGTLTALAVERDYTDFFPSLNMRYEAGDDLVLRLAGQRGVSRPAYGAIRVGASINDTTTPGEIGGGNPGLKPEYTWGLDASVEYYLPGNGILSVAGFYRWVDNVFYQSQQPVGSDVFNSGGVDRSNYLLSSTFNGENGKLYGVEFNFQNQFDFLPSPFDGLGFQGNLTLLDGEFDIPAAGGNAAQRGIAFQGLSDTIANASLFYEKYGFSARVSYQWRSDWLDTLGGLGSGEYRKGYENLDISLRYAVNDNLTVFADLANLTDEVYLAYSGSTAFPTEVEQIGSRYLFGLRFNF